VIFRAKGQVPDKPAAGAGANGGGEARPATARAAGGGAKAAPRPRDARQVRLGQTFAQVVAVLMRDPNFRTLRLADLEWLAIPPIMAGQFRLAHAVRPTAASRTDQTSSGGGVSVPVAVALWARVSPEIDKALSETLDKPVRLRPNQWASGDHIWLLAVAGDRRAVGHFLKQLAEGVFKGQHVKMRLRGPDGKTIVKALVQDG
jgi:hemolysin-activating ACP:hemolysin acyltransferase